MVEKASWFSRYGAIPALVVTSSVSSLLLYSCIVDYRSKPDFARLVMENGTWVGQIIHVLSRVLGTMMVYALCNAINLSARAYLCNSPITLDRLKLLANVCIAHIDFSLPSAPLACLMLFVLASSIPAILWTGALTPVPSTKITTHRLPLPAYSNWTGFTADVTDNATYTLNTGLGMFSWLPHFNFQGSMLQAARDASNRSDTNGGLRPHAKLDRTGFTYTTRSYGMGAPVGLKDDADEGHAFGVPVTGYKYSEAGLLPSASCSYNESSEFFLYAFPVPDDWSLHVFNAMGFLPNNASTMHAAAALGPNEVLAMAAGSTGADFEASTYYMALASGNSTDSNYGRLDKVQCQIVFEPRMFSIEVNTTLKTIAVNAQETIEAPPHAHNITSRAFRHLDTMAGIFDTTIWISVIGDTFMYNIANVEARPGVKVNDPTATFTGVKDSFESLLDNMLLAYASAQLMVYNDTKSLPAEAHVQAITFGNSRDIYIIFALNIIISLVYAGSLIYISGWPEVGKFNFTDIKSIVIGTSAGGYAIAEKAQGLHRAKGGQWAAAEDDKLVGRIQVRLCGTSASGADEEAKVVLANEEGGQHLEQFGERSTLRHGHYRSNSTPLMKYHSSSTSDHQALLSARNEIHTPEQPHSRHRSYQILEYPHPQEARHSSIRRYDHSFSPSTPYSLSSHTIPPLPTQSSERSSSSPQTPYSPDSPRSPRSAFEIHAAQHDGLQRSDFDSYTAPDLGSLRRHNQVSFLRGGFI